MGIFSTIKDKIFGHKAAPQTQAAAPVAPRPAAPMGQSPVTAQPAQAVDVEAVLQEMEGQSGQKLNWHNSIVDLMKLLGIESSLSNRKELAQELGYTGALDGSAEMNIWLHKATMKELAKNGGRVPVSMMD